MIYYLTARRHAYTMNDFLASWGKPLAGRIRMLLYEDLFSGAHVELTRGTYIFTCLGRTLGSRDPPSPARKLVCELRSRLVQAFGPARVLNDPGAFLGRVDLLRTLQANGMNRFTINRAATTAVPPRFPVFLRREHGTEWNMPPLLHDAGEYRLAVRAAGSTDGLVAVEFCDTADAEGVYHKYGCFIVGGAIVPRHLLFSRRWLVKEADLCDEGKLGEELAFLEANPHAAHLREVASLANIAYGRIDYAIAGGRPQVWEINTTPAIVSPPGHDLDARAPVHRRFVELLAAAFDQVDPPGG